MPRDPAQACGEALRSPFKRFHVRSNPARLWNTKDMTAVMQACIAVLYTIIEERRSEYTTYRARGPRNYNALTQKNR